MKIFMEVKIIKILFTVNNKINYAIEEKKSVRQFL